MIFSIFSKKLNILWHLENMSESSSVNQAISTDDTLMYLNEIKDAFKDEVEKFNDFIDIMRDFKERRFDLFFIYIETKIYSLRSLL
jgi:histone deacetylase complex regulatory component SIN3